MLYQGRPNSRCRRLGERLKLLLEYAVTPPYLKKRLFPMRPELRYVGLMPPLQIETHDVSETPSEGEARLGLAEGLENGAIRFFVGLKEEVRVEPPGVMRIRKGDIVPLILEEGRWRILHKEEGRYLGYKVLYERGKSLVEILKTYEGVRVGTSRLGDALWQNLVTFVEKLRTSRRVAIFFGDPYMGLEDILPMMGVPNVREVFDFFFNFIPNQGTKSVRVEEALAAVLQTIAFLLSARSV